MTANAIAPFLASSDEVAVTLRVDADFSQFLALALKNSGESVTAAQASVARYRIIDARLGLRDELRADEVIACAGKPVLIRELVAACCDVDRTQLVHSLWRLQTFDEIKAWLKALRAVVRYAYNVEGELRGHLLLSETIVPMVETVERRDYVLPNGDMASDAITRNLGIRAKVFALDRQYRLPRTPASHSIMDRLSRTLSKANR